MLRTETAEKRGVIEGTKTAGERARERWRKRRDIRVKDEDEEEHESEQRG